MMGILRGLRAQPRTLLLCIHQLNDAERICDRLLLLSGGRLVGVGTLAELRAQTGLSTAAWRRSFLRSLEGQRRLSTPVRILVAEGDEALARIIDRGLRAHGFEVASVGSAADAVLLASDASVRLLLLDLPAQDEVLATIRANRPDLPIMLLVARGHRGTPAEEWLQKPFAFEELIARIRALTRRANERRVTTLFAGDLRSTCWRAAPGGATA